ncbi:MAG: Tryptophanase, partial [Streblomastix strix]
MSRAPVQQIQQSFDIIQTTEDLGVPIPAFTNFVVRPTHAVTPSEREEVQRRTEYNPFSFPAAMLIADFLSDSGVSAMIDVQWASMFRSDESYGRNHGYFALHDSIRDVFERGDNVRRLVDQVIINAPNETWKPNDQEDIQGGFVNSGRWQLERPNCFITPQGRCAENLLYTTIRESMEIRYPDRQHKLFIPSNGWFDTTEAHARNNRIVPVNLFAANFSEPFDPKDVGIKNTFKGNIDIERLEKLISEEGGENAENIPIILLTITNNTAAGQPVSMENVKKTAQIAAKYNIPLLFDAARFAENAFFIHKYEAEYKHKSIPEIVRELFSYCDGFTLSAKKDGLANMGGLLCFRDQGLFHKKFSIYEEKEGKKVIIRDIGVMLKEKQILMYGNDSYGGLS